MSEITMDDCFDYQLEVEMGDFINNMSIYIFVTHFNMKKIKN